MKIGVVQTGKVTNMNLSGFIASFAKISEWFMNFLLLNGLWLLFNFPIVYLLLDIIFRDSIDEVFMLLMAIFILLPFLFFPATAAMFAIVRRWMMKRPVGNLFTRFLRHYKENYLRSLIGSLIFMPIYFVWVWNFLIANIPYATVTFYFYIIILFIIISLTCYYFSDIVHFDIRLRDSLHKIVFMAIFYFPYTLGAAAASLIVGAILYAIHPLILLLFGGSLISYIYFFAYHQIYLRAKAKAAVESEK